MGMYTECYVNCRLIKDLPKEVVDVLEYLFNNRDGKMVEPTLPDHKLFKSDSILWRHIGRMSSYFHIPHVTNSFLMDEESEHYYLTSRSDLKNYANEIGLFFDWLMPYVDRFPGEFIGYERYEDSDLPDILYVKKDDCNMRTRSKELQEAYDEYEKIKRKIESSMNDFFDNPTQEGLDKLFKYLSEQAAPDYSKVEKLIENWKELQ